MKLDYNQQAFLSLVRAGLWEKEAQPLPFESIDYNAIYRLALEQSVVGLVTAGVECISNLKPPQETTLMFVGDALQLEQRNKSMNKFVAELIVKMRSADIYALLVKGQGIAQCYERPLWRACGDVDLHLSYDNYFKALKFLTPLASSVEEIPERLHAELNICNWNLELHGSLRSGLLKRLDQVINEVQKEIFNGGSKRLWMNGSTQVFLPGVDEDVFLVFSHILQHYYQEGIGLRQICDWCRLLWTYKDDIKVNLLESRIKKAGIFPEWKAFAYLAVNCLGMPSDAMPFYSSDIKWKQKADNVLGYIIRTGSFGNKRDYSFRSKVSPIRRKLIMFWRITSDSIYQVHIFPINTMKIWLRQMLSGLNPSFVRVQ